MQRWRALVPAAVVLAAFAAGTADGQTAPAEQKKLIVGTKHSPPFAIKNADGTWSGVSIDLWRQIAERLQLPYEFREKDLQGLIDGVKDGELDAAVAALTVTAERERVLDFTHPFHSTGLGIAVVPQGRGGWLAVVGKVASSGFVKVVAGLTLLLLVVGLLVWAFERRKNPEQFGGGPLRGIGAGFWWSAVTMTTVGYGDKAPRTLAGRLVGLVWMFAAIVIISSFTAAIASALTVSQLESPVQGPRDLPAVRVGTLAGSTSEDYLKANHISHKTYSQVTDGLKALRDGRIDAFVYDAPILRYLTNTQFREVLAVLPRTFERQDYAIALRSGSELREPINRVLVEKIRQPAWQDVLYRYLGR